MESELKSLLLSEEAYEYTKDFRLQIMSGNKYIIVINLVREIFSMV